MDFVKFRHGGTPLVPKYHVIIYVDHVINFYKFDWLFLKKNVLHNCIYYD